MKYRKKKYSKKKIHIKQKKKKTKKTIKKYKGGAAEQPKAVAPQYTYFTSDWKITNDDTTEPTPPKLMTEPSGENMKTMRKTILRTNNTLDKNPKCKTPTNCLPVAADVISEEGYSPEVFTKWIEDTEAYATSGDMNLMAKLQQEQLMDKGLYKLNYLRNFSSRPPIESLNEKEEKIWTDEHIIVFLSDLIKSGIKKKANYNPDNPDHKFTDGCLHVEIKQLGRGPAHSIVFCKQGNHLFVIDLQLYQKMNIGPIRGIVGPDQLHNYFSQYSNNIFGIYTNQYDKYVNHNNILKSRLLDVQINFQLNKTAMALGVEQINDVGPDNKPLNDEQINKLLPTIIEHHILNMAPIIFPAILADPYVAAVYNNPMFNKKYLIPIIFGFNEHTKWPDSVKDKAKKYSQFQDNQYGIEIRQAALTAILNGKNNEYLDELIDHGEHPTAPLMLPPLPPSPPSSPTQGASGEYVLGAASIWDDHMEID